MNETKILPTIILHMDVNKTLIVSDRSCDVPMSQMVNSILSETVWGTLRGCDGGLSKAEWVLYSSIPSTAQPAENTITYADYIENYLDLPRPEAKELACTFTDDGHIGNSCRHYYDNILDALKIKSTVDIPKDCEYLQNGCYHILPSFFELLIYLNQNHINYKLIFRTFGSDVKNIENEYNLFCDNHHPIFPLPDGMSMNGNSHSSDRRIQPSYSHCRIQRISDSDMILQYLNEDMVNIYMYLYI